MPLVIAAKRILWTASGAASPDIGNAAWIRITTSCEQSHRLIDSSVRNYCGRRWSLLSLDDDGSFLVLEAGIGGS
jgi:hypothetical protein